MNPDYDLALMKPELASRLQDFVDCRLSLQLLREYAWQQHDSWERIDDSTLPVETEDDRVYWSALYDVLNLGDTPLEFHPTIHDIKQHILCLQGQTKLAPEIRATRPCRGNPGIIDPSRKPIRGRGVNH